MRGFFEHLSFGGDFEREKSKLMYHRLKDAEYHVQGTADIGQLA